MDENVAFIIDAMTESFDAALKHFEKELLTIRAGKASPLMLDGVMVEYYGAPTPIKQVASVATQDARTLVVTPFDRSALNNIERGIIAANLGFNPSNNGTMIIIPIPLLTEERRKGLVRQARAESENAKVSLRNSRRDANSDLKKLKDEGVSEDEIKRGEEKVNEIINHYGDKIDEILKRKEEEIMTI